MTNLRKNKLEIKSHVLISGSIIVAAIIIAIGLYTGLKSNSGASDYDTFINNLEQFRDDEIAKQEKAAIDASSKKLKGNPALNLKENEPFKGAEDAKVTIIEYSDIDCPFCKKVHLTFNKLVSEYPNDIKWVYRHLPLAFHPDAKKKAIASECAKDQGKYFNYLDTMFEENTLVADLVPLAEKLELDTTKFKSCLEDPAIAKRIDDDMEGARSLGGEGTPFNVLIDSEGKAQAVSGALPYHLFKQKVDAIIK